MNDAERAIIKEAVEALSRVVDNAEGYDRSNFAAAVLAVDRMGGSLGAWTKDQLLDADERARNAWRGLQSLLAETRDDEAHLLSSRTNAARLHAAIESAHARTGIPVDMDELRAQINDG